MSVLSERNRQIVRLATAGERPAAIVDRLDPRPSLQTVYNVLCAARAKGLDIPRFPSGPVGATVDAATCVLKLPRSVVLALGDAAQARGTTASNLAEQILAHVVEDGLVAAVLDDGGGR